MKLNLGTTDRILRAIVGLGIIAYGYASNSWLGAIGILPLVTALVAFCPGYFPFKISTRGTGGKPGGGCGCSGGHCG